MLLSSNFTQKPMLSSTLRVTRSMQPVELINIVENDLYTLEDAQISKTQREIESAISDLKNFLDIDICDEAPRVQPTAVMSPEKTKEILDLVD